MNALWSLALALLLAPAALADSLSEKESFMLMFGKGNGAMRVLCEPGDSANDRRHARIGMAFADRRPGLCPERLIQPSATEGTKAHP